MCFCVVQWVSVPFDFLPIQFSYFSTCQCFSIHPQCMFCACQCFSVLLFKRLYAYSVFVNDLFRLLDGVVCFAILVNALLRVFAKLCLCVLKVLKLISGTCQCLFHAWPLLSNVVEFFSTLFGTVPKSCLCFSMCFYGFRFVECFPIIFQRLSILSMLFDVIQLFVGALLLLFDTFLWICICLPMVV